MKTSPDHPISYEVALTKLREAGLPTDVMRRGGPGRWDGFTLAAGTTGQLLPGGQRLDSLRQGNDVGPSATIECAGMPSFTGVLTVEVRTGVPITALIRRHGNLEVTTDPPMHGSRGDADFWDLRTRDVTFVVERTIDYLTDRDVFSAQPLQACTSTAQPGSGTSLRGCDVSV